MVQEEGILPGHSASETTEALGMTSGEIVIDLEEGLPK